MSSMSLSMKQYQQNLSTTVLCVFVFIQHLSATKGTFECKTELMRC